MGVAQRPPFDREAAERLAFEHFGLRARARELPSERDRNFRLDLASGDRYLLKIANADEPREVLEFQQLALAQLAASPLARYVPRDVTGRWGDALEVVAGAGGESHYLRLLSYLPGRPLAASARRTPTLHRSVGELLGRLDRILADLDHPAADRWLQWDAKVAPKVVEQHHRAIASAGGRELVRVSLERYRRRRASAGRGWRQSVIHNDANDHNLLLDDRGALCGIIDFGDLVRSYTVAELAVACAYVMMGAEDPLAVAVQVAAGYLAHQPLNEAETASLLDLIRLRLCLSVSLSARQARLAPDNPYLRVSEGPAWTLLARLAELDDGALEARL